MEYRERTWWIRYYKLRTTWIKQFPEKKFPPDKYQPFRDVKPWDEPNYLNGYLGVNHEVNWCLHKIEMFFLDSGLNWIHTKLEDIDFPDMIECNFSDLEGCSDCRFRFKCELKA
nr:unnamed protein product [uncultured archaeal virus]